MVKKDKTLCIIIVLVLIFYYLIGSLTNNITYATTTRHRENTIENLDNNKYPGIEALIKELKTAHPNWSFTILYTGLDWENVIENETTAYHGRSLVQNSSDAWICPTCGKSAYDSGTWYCASNATVKYYMDIRNWMKEDYIFAFETLSYNASIHNIEGVKSILSGTFMDKDTITYTDTAGKTQTINKSYAQVIMDAASKYNISPYHIASRLRQEQGTTGTDLSSGKCNYQDDNGNSLIGYYNFFNIRATGNGNAEICKRGLSYAKNNGWTNPELAIYGGAETLASSYISNYQDCLYLQKYQVDKEGGLYSHQYMQNVSAPYSEGYSVYEAYKEIGALNNNFNFIIPVFENMPNSISPIPISNMSIVTENVRIATEQSDLPLRESNSAYASCLTYLPRNSVVLRIEKATSKQNGYYWDKIVYNAGNKIYIGYANSQYLAKIDDVTTVNIDATINEETNLRNGPGLLKTTVVKTLAKETKLKIIDKMQYSIDGYIWYRVKLSDGKQGYIPSKYVIETINETGMQADSGITIDPPVVVLSQYIEDGNNIIIAPGTKIEDIQDAKLIDKVLGTGAKIKIKEKEYIVVMLGDTNGDGNITPADYVKIKNKIMGTSTLTGANQIAADVNKDKNITPADYVKVKNHIMNVSKISLQ